MIITIARQCGCGAVNVGKLLVVFFVFFFYTRKSLLQMASEKGVLDEMEAFFEERPVDELLFAMSSFGETRKDSTERPLRVLADMIGDENCIIIGRCGPYIFRESKELDYVFISIIPDLPGEMPMIMTFGWIAIGREQKKQPV